MNLNRGTKQLRRKAAIVAATVGVLAYQHASQATTFVISTSGATALGSFNRGNSNADAPTTGTIVRGPFLSSDRIDSLHR
jgi:hypothetical protein